MERLTEKVKDCFGYRLKDGSDAEVGYFKDYNAFYSHMMMVKVLGEYEDLEELIGMPLEDLAKIFRQNIPEDCKHPQKAIALTNDDVDRWHVYKNAEEQGLLLRLPCKVGDTVYYISEGFIEPCTVETIFISDYTDKDGNCSYMAEIHYDREDCPYVSTEIYFTDIGKTVFLTKAEAEQKFKELRGEQNGKID